MPHVFDHIPTKQEVFDASCDFFATQPGPAISELGSCVYRTGDRVCAAGNFIPDQVYHPAMDKMDGSTGIGNLISNFGDVLPSWFVSYERMLMDLQQVHDIPPHHRNGSEWNYSAVAKAMHGVADYHKLDDSAVAKIEQRAKES